MIKKQRISLLLLILILTGYQSVSAQNPKSVYPSIDNRKPTAGKTTYYINPETGDDHNTGIKSSQPWKTFKNANQLIFSAGDTLAILAGGTFRETLMITAKGNKQSPVIVHFAPGRYDFYPETSFKQQLHISNTNDDPFTPKAIALYFVNSRFVNVKANGANIVLRGKMIETYIDHSEDISLEGFSFDYQRPTVSELKVISVNDNYADVQIHPDSKYSIKDSLLTWEGEGWRYQPGYYWQVFNPQTQKVSRTSFDMNGVRFTETAKNQVRIHFSKNPGLQSGLTYQNRDVTRDCAGIFMERSKNISWKNINIYFMHGMGVVSQFCENIKLDAFNVKPAPQSGRTCAAWADILHFSGCKGKIEVSNSYLSAANDDAINVHGTHLQIIETPQPNQVKVRFVHNQTYGFEAFIPGDQIDYVHSESLLSYGTNTITAVKRLNDKEILLTLKNKLPAGKHAGNVIENNTWTPEVWVHDNLITHIPTRGILVTTQRKVVIENNDFQRVNSSGILVNDDAEGWYESGKVRDLTIRGNKFIQCGTPVINLHPENKVNEGAVHKNIFILNNLFELQDENMLSAKSISNLVFSGNTIKTLKTADLKELIKLENCTDVKTSGNKLSVIQPAENK